MKYILNLELDFRDEASCKYCPLMASNDCDEKWCVITQTALNHYLDKKLVNLWHGDRPEWCPLQHVELENM